MHGIAQYTGFCSEGVVQCTLLCKAQPSMKPFVMHSAARRVMHSIAQCTGFCSKVVQCVVQNTGFTMKDLCYLCHVQCCAMHGLFQ